MPQRPRSTDALLIPSVFAALKLWMEASATGGNTDDYPHGAEAGHVDELVVDRRARGRGLGSSLMAEFLRRMRTRGCAEVSVGVLRQNQRAQRLHRAMGFTEEMLLLEQRF
jgi:ribosomal protein S18 acetylase RimI-like enzyme